MPQEPFGWLEGSDLVNAVGDERELAGRLQVEREARGWSQAELSKRMAAAGHPIHQSAISKIETPPKDGRRAISINEAIGFSKVFGIALGELLLPTDAVRDVAAWKAYVDASEVRNRIRHAEGEYEDLIDQLRPFAATSQSFTARLRAYRDEILHEIEATLRPIEEDEGREWDASVIGSVYQLPPAIRVIDDILQDQPESESK